jgi:polysaccharide biosynthesis/export protein
VEFDLTMTNNRSLTTTIYGCSVVAVLAFFAATNVVAQAVSPGDALQVFQGLSPEQQQAVLERAGSSGSPVVTSGGNASDQAMQSADRDALRRKQEIAEAPTEVLKAEDTVVLELSFPLERPAEASGKDAASEQAAAARRQRMVTALNPSQRSELERLIELVQMGNPYVLDRSSQLILPGFAPIALGGLTKEQATQRLSFEPALLALEVHLVKLPLSRTGVAGLKPFGYDLFENVPSSFSPVTDVPVPADYVIGAGDELSVQLYGNQNRTLRLSVNRDGSITFPGLGPIQISGLTFNAAKRVVESRVEQQMIGVRANVSMRETRSIRVFVTGEARQRGSYTVSGLATMTTALFASGGVLPIGSLRDIHLKRQGVTVRRFDLYDMLIRGDTSDDAKLLPGDVIFIPPVGATIAVEGEVKRPAVYELNGETTVGEVVQMAGGLTPEADRSRGSLTRIDENSRRIVLGINLNLPVSRDQIARNGDVLRIARLRPQLDSGITISGFVYRTGPMAWREGLRLSDVIGSVDELRANADPHYILIRRESGPDRRISGLSADLIAALASPGSAADALLTPLDQITVFDLAPGRERIVKPLLEELQLQSELSRPAEVVQVGGRVRVPGEYPLEPGMKVSDLLRAGGGLSASAYTGQAELARYFVNAEGTRQTELVTVDLAALRRGVASADLVLQPYDYLVVKETPEWTQQESVTVRGEVQFPGTYAIRRGETLRQVIDRAGGLTTKAFQKGSAFTRRETREIEQKQLDQLGERLQSSLVTMSLQAAAANQAGASQALASAQPWLLQLRGSKAVGRLRIDMPGLMTSQPGSVKDIELRDGDDLVVPRQRNEVTVIGEVQGATSHLYTAGLTRDDYIDLSGGATRKADRRQIYVVRADGSIVARDSSLFQRSYRVAIQPGDTIVVPLDTERLPRLPFWQAVTGIIYNLAVSVAAINSF